MITKATKAVVQWKTKQSYDNVPVKSQMFKSQCSAKNIVMSGKSVDIIEDYSIDTVQPQECFLKLKFYFALSTAFFIFTAH